MTNLDSAAVSEFEALQRLILTLQPLEPEVRRRLFSAAATFLQIDMGSAAQPGQTRSTTPAPGSAEAAKYPPFSADMAPSPKEFVLQKQPRTDVERVAVLAYYLTHFRDTPHFKTLDLTLLNTEAAQPKFSNAANSTSNASKQRYLVSSSGGRRQLSAVGEQFVNALPDREAAKAAMTAAAPRRPSRRRTAAKKASTPQERIPRKQLPLQDAET